MKATMRTTFDLSQMGFEKITISTADNPPPGMAALPHLDDSEIDKKISLVMPTFRILETRCAWCDDEAGVRVMGEGITHSICPRHLVSNLVFSNQEDTFEALFYTILGILAEGQR